MNAPAPVRTNLRRGACPGLSAPMPTGDGLLARLTPSGATVALDAFAGLCEAARSHGNGIVEITSRGSIQVRGLGAASARDFAAAVAALGIEACDGVPVLVDPLHGLADDGTAEAGSVAAEIRGALATAPFASRLAAKVSAIVDGGGALHLDDVPADVRLRAMVVPGAGYRLALAGDAATAVALGAVAASRAAECVMRLLGVLAKRAPQGRMRDAIASGGLDAFKAAVAGLAVDAPPPLVRPVAEPVGAHPLRDGKLALGLGLAFGHSDAATLLRLVDAARGVGASGLRTAPGRVLLVLGLAPDAARQFTATAAALGFIVAPGDPRRRVVACAGAPVCASGEIPARALAPAVAWALAAMPDAPPLVHVSGCAKGCAHPGPAPVAVIGRAGACDVYCHGALAGSVPVEELPGRIAAFIRPGAEADHG